MKISEALRKYKGHGAEKKNNTVLEEARVLLFSPNSVAAAFPRRSRRRRRDGRQGEAAGAASSFPSI
jgi:hypothetical protein